MSADRSPAFASVEAPQEPDASASTTRTTAGWRELPPVPDVLRARAFGSAPSETVAMAPTAVTVVVCTYRRPESTIRFLDSLAGQLRSAALILVDASEDERTERAVAAYADPARLADYVAYYRVDRPRRGLTRQYNFGLALVRTPLVAFFDDDIVLQPDCMRALVDAHARGGGALVGVGAAVDNEPARPPIWRLRRLLGIVPSLAPGRYFPSGVSTPWGFVAPGDRLVEGDWLPGGATMWRTEAARAVGFEEALGGYGCGNDLAFSLRMATHGRLVICAAARVLHLQDPAGRPDPRAMGFEATRNAHAIHRAFAPRGRWARAWFAYAIAADTLLTAAAGLRRPGRARATIAQLRGVVDYWRARGAARPTITSSAGDS